MHTYNVICFKIIYGCWFSTIAIRAEITLPTALLCRFHIFTFILILFWRQRHRCCLYFIIDRLLKSQVASQSKSLHNTTNQEINKASLFFDFVLLIMKELVHLWWSKHKSGQSVEQNHITLWTLSLYCLEGYSAEKFQKRKNMIKKRYNR